MVSPNLPPFQLMLHCLEHLNPNDWSSFIHLNAATPEIRSQTLKLVESHQKSDSWLPIDDDDSRISIKDHWSGAKAIRTPQEGDRFTEQDIQLIELIGRGTANLVYLASQVRVPRNRFVIKTPTHCNHPQKQLERYADEYEVHLGARHPNVAQILSFGNLTKDRPFLSMEFVPGMKMGQYLVNPNYSIPRKLSALTEICSATADLHRRGISHGDLNPDNIIVSNPQGIPHPKLIDFGKAVSRQLTGNLAPHDVSSMEPQGENNNPPHGKQESSMTATNMYAVNQMRDVRAVSYLLYTFLAANRNEHQIATLCGERVADQLISLQESICWDVTGDHQSPLDRIAQQLKEIEPEVATGFPV